MSFYWVWVPAAVLLYIICAFFTKWANDDLSWRPVIALYVLNCFGLWPLIARFSKNVVVDGLLYDLIIFFSFYLTMLYLGAAEKFTFTQWVGTGMLAAGLIVIKVGEFWR